MCRLRGNVVPVCLSISTSVSSVGAPSRSFSVRRLPLAFSNLEKMMENTDQHDKRKLSVPGRRGVSTHQLKEQCRLAQRLGCWVSEVSDRAAFPLLWCGKTAGENTLFILRALWGQPPCSLSKT